MALPAQAGAVPNIAAAPRVTSQPRDLSARFSPCCCLPPAALKPCCCRLALQVDPSIIGGVILAMGDKYVDMSILARVKRLQQIVRDAV